MCPYKTPRKWKNIFLLCWWCPFLPSSDVFGVLCVFSSFWIIGNYVHTSIFQEHTAEIRYFKDKVECWIWVFVDFFKWLVGFGVLLIVFLIRLEFPFLPINSLYFKKRNVLNKMSSLWQNISGSRLPQSMKKVKMTTKFYFYTYSKEKNHGVREAWTVISGIHNVTKK